MYFFLDRFSRHSSSVHYPNLFPRPFPRLGPRPVLRCFIFIFSMTVHEGQVDILNEVVSSVSKMMMPQGRRQTACRSKKRWSKIAEHYLLFHEGKSSWTNIKRAYVCACVLLTSPRLPHAKFGQNDGNSSPRRGDRRFRRLAGFPRFLSGTLRLYQIQKANENWRWLRPPASYGSTFFGHHHFTSLWSKRRRRWWWELTNMIFME